MGPGRYVIGFSLAVLVLIAPPCVGQEALSRALTVYNLPDVPPDPVTYALSRPYTVYNFPDVPPDPVTFAVSRPVTVYNLPDNPPDEVTQAYSRPLTIRGGDLSATPEDELPMMFSLHSARPNPFNPQTRIAFSLPSRVKVSLYVYDLSGRRLRLLLAGVRFNAGHHEVVWNGRDDSGRQVASGTYFYRLEAGEYSETKRMALIK